MDVYGSVWHITSQVNLFKSTNFLRLFFDRFPTILKEKRIKDQEVGN